MPAYYKFKCNNCGWIEQRYRNVKRCRKCHGSIERITPPTYKELWKTLNKINALALSHDSEHNNFLKAIEISGNVLMQGSEKEAVLSKQIQAVLQLKEKHKDTWRDKPDDYWLARLMEETGELASSLVGHHEHDPDWELSQISAICMNWLEKREG